MNVREKTFHTVPEVKFGVCPRCGHKNGLNPFRFDGLSRATYRASSHKIIHHKCKKCSWMGYIMIGSNSRIINAMINTGFYMIWALVFLIVPLSIYVLCF